MAAAVAWDMQGEWENLWPDGAMPVVEGQAATNGTPAIQWWLPEKRTTDAVMIVTPGGGYNHWSYNVEGRTCEYFCEKGMACVILRYRVPRPPKGSPIYKGAWMDAQRAVRIVRRDAAKYGCSPDKIGMLGFSAGGHLALLAAASSQSIAYGRVDEADDIPCHLDWCAALYPAYVLADGKSGPNAKETCGNDLATEINPEFKFDGATPPVFLMHGDDDKYSAMGSVRIYHKLRTMGIPAELHVLARKGHVFFRNAKPCEPAALWKDRVWEWFAFMEESGGFHNRNVK